MNSERKQIAQNAASYCILIFIFLFSGVALFDFAGFLIWDDVLLIGLLMLIISITLLIVANIIPQGIRDSIRNYGPAVLVVSGILFFVAIFSLWIPFIVTYMSDLQLDAPDALAFSIYFTFVAALSVLLWNAYSYQKHDVFSQKQADLNALVLSRLGQISRPALTEHRLRLITDDHPINFSIEKTKNFVGIYSALIVISITLSIGIKSLEYTAVWVSPSPYPGELAPLMYIGVFFILLLNSLRYYRRWRLSWIEYWQIIRMFSAPDGVILDSLGRVGSSLHASMKSEEGDETWQHAKELIQRYGLYSIDADDADHMEYANWYQRTFQKLGKIRLVQFERHERIDEFKQEFEKLGEKYPRGRFVELIRQSILLDARNLMKTFPDIFDSVSELFYSKIDIDNQNDPFELSINQIEDIRGFSPIPIPSSASWLLGFFLFALTILPYALSVGFFP